MIFLNENKIDFLKGIVQYTLVKHQNAFNGLIILIINL